MESAGMRATSQTSSLNLRQEKWLIDQMSIKTTISQVKLPMSGKNVLEIPFYNPLVGASGIFVRLPKWETVCLPKIKRKTAPGFESVKHEQYKLEKQTHLLTFDQLIGPKTYDN